jgi:hypothetical protein
MNLRHRPFVLMLTACALSLCIHRAEASLLDPNSFASLGANPFTLAGTYTIDTSGGTPTLTLPNATVINRLRAEWVRADTWTRKPQGFIL